MKRAILILMSMCLCLSSSGCPASIRAVNSEARTPPPQNMGAACDPMGVAAVPTKIEGLTKLEPGAECNARYRCDQAGGCSLEVTSRAVEKNAALAFVFDAQGGVSGPSAAGGPEPALQIVSVLLEKAGFYGTGSGPQPELSALTGRHWKRVYAVRSVGQDPPLALTVTVKLPRGSVLGAFGFVRYDGQPMTP